jgi:serine phosphatase RsbU (regulator of sigma subunit)
MAPAELRAKEWGIVIGRQEQCDIRLAADTVSRAHARLTFDGGQWRIVDLKSRWGTFLNGCRLEQGREVPLKEGDLIRMTPWTFSFTTRSGRKRGVESLNDVESMSSLVRPVTCTQGGMADDLLALLLEAAAGMQAAENEQAMAEVMLDAAVRGTALPNAAVLRPVDAAGRVEIMACRRGPGGGGMAMYSRALLAEASKGMVAELSGMNMPVTSESIVRMRIDRAICVPLMLGSAVAAYLYLDSRGGLGAGAKVEPSATAFCVGIGRIAGLAMANLKRIDIERRQAAMEAELAAGAEAQRWILPPRENVVGRFRYVGESRPGQSMGGDFFDVIPLDEHRVAVALGDVAGNGIAASVLMTAAQGFLHAALREHGQPERAVSDLNRFVLPRRPAGKFITLWVGVFDSREMTVRYVDAGHGYVLMVEPGGATRLLTSEDGLPVGLGADSRYSAESAALRPGAGLLALSDGIVEQPGAGRQFGVEGVRAYLAGLKEGEDAVGGLFDAVVEHAGSQSLADDATAVMVRWEASGKGGSSLGGTV